MIDQGQDSWGEHSSSMILMDLPPLSTAAGSEHRASKCWQKAHDDDTLATDD